ncbi:hypothetical protein C9374_008185 [Naegleria lovaniensis]|uniref:F-box domain-containing protein n=1 Tax=Naegleria lovaniensis TaxID=51637 RepID=A0AA88GL65_NAELO|nr:uncharacterized protein C9374_008185 [Naegleria lovaniensis]KAG2378546.1 hypothetical protein C9374_008185 [Naegleria lovaniensis]
MDKVDEEPETKHDETGRDQEVVEQTKKRSALLLIGLDSIIKTVLSDHVFPKKTQNEEKAVFQYSDMEVHPYFGHVTLEKGKLKQWLGSAKTKLTSSECVKLVMGVDFGGDTNKIRWLCHSASLETHELFNTERLDDVWAALEWKLTDERWSLRCENDMIKATHFGCDEDVLNHDLQPQYCENYEIIVDDFIDSSVETISKLGAYNISKILSFLDLEGINACYNSCRLMRRLIASRDFTMAYILDKCIALPSHFIEHNGELLREKTVPELKAIIFNYCSKISIINNFSITWLNDTYWKREKRSDSPFKSVAHLCFVWWLDIAGRISLIKGDYEVFLKYKNTKANGYDRYNLNIDCRPVETGHESNADVSNLNTVCNISIGAGSSKLHKLGEIRVLVPRQDFRFKIFDHDCNEIKQEMDFDYLEFKRK